LHSAGRVGRVRHPLLMNKILVLRLGPPRYRRPAAIFFAARQYSRSKIKVAITWSWYDIHVTSCWRISCVFLLSLRPARGTTIERCDGLPAQKWCHQAPLIPCQAVCQAQERRQRQQSGTRSSSLISAPLRQPKRSHRPKPSQMHQRMPWIWPCTSQTCSG